MQLDEAVTTKEILTALAHFEWWETNQTECPENLIPTQSDLADWETCPMNAKAEANSILGQLFDKVGGTRWHTLDDDPLILVAIFVEEEEIGNQDSEEYYKEYHLEVAMITDVHKKWLQLPSKDRQRHPLGPLVRAWQLQPVSRQPNKRNDPILPVVRQIEVEVPLERRAGQRMLGLETDSSEEEAIPLLPGFLDQPDQARRVPLLALADVSGTPSRSQGRGAAPDLRLIVEVMLSVQPDDRTLPAVALVFTIEELRDALFPNGWRVGTDWPRMRGTLLRMNERGIPINERGNRWYPLAIRQLPSETGMHLNDEIIIEAALPPGSKAGPVIDRRQLRQLSVQSSPQYRAYIGVHSLAWEPGVTRIVNPQTKNRGWTGNLEAYPVLTLEDRRMIAFGLGDNKHRTKRDINQAFTNLPKTIVMDEDAVNRKTGARGWRVLPVEAANAVLRIDGGAT